MTFFWKLGFNYSNDKPSAVRRWSFHPVFNSRREGFATSVSNFVHTWGVHIKGPVYVAVFKPFSIAVAAFMSTIFLGEPLYLGSVIRATMLFIGFYAVMWGKAKEEAVMDNSNLVTSSEDQLPLLQSYEFIIALPRKALATTERKRSMKPLCLLF
ncbi:hypothetical protein SLEP1_g20180 [Rubroshorea leprosula]|uniref:WAT1-related protein n=1 Tax=Rubroshorea leprosula TaxID=152421 RepID=A0AAV5JAN2_9ROSI|nr:hypothetical protein SLEP1_g20180 [Rubroshorea leprosula]